MIAAAVVGILICLFFILGALFSLLAFGLMPAASDVPVMPAFVRPMMIGMMVIFIGVSLFGIVACANVLRLRNWARISMLICGGIMAVFSGVALIGVWFVSLPESASASQISTQAIRTMMVAIYGLPVAIGIWWLILFNRQAIKEQFVPVPVGSELPQETSTPRCPLPLAILAGFNIFSVACCAFVPLLRLPFNVILFAHRFHGLAGGILFTLTASLLLIGAIGLLKLKRWSYPIVLGLNFFWLASGTVSLLSSNYEQNLHDIVSQMNLPESAVTANTFAQSRVFGIISLIPIVFLIWLLLYYHTRFVEACVAKEALRHN